MFTTIIAHAGAWALTRLTCGDHILVAEVPAPVAAPGRTQPVTIPAVPATATCPIHGSQPVSATLHRVEVTPASRQVKEVRDVINEARRVEREIRQSHPNLGVALDSLVRLDTFETTGRQV